MAYEIEWTLNAREDLKAIISYLQDEWSEGIAENFVIECFSKIDLISKFPFIGTASEKLETVRRIQITKHNALYFSIDGQKIVLLDFFDTRQNPTKDIFK